MNAIVKDNKVYCPFCTEHDYRITDCKQIKQGTQMQVSCRKCNREFEYMIKLKVENTLRFIVEESVNIENA